jgi:hypothetical protein
VREGRTWAAIDQDTRGRSAEQQKNPRNEPRSKSSLPEHAYEERP